MVVTTVSRTEKTTPEITKRTDEHGNIVITVGDVNDNGRVSGLDAAIIARKLAEGRSSDLNKWAADYNGDGKVTALDCAEIARFLAKLSIIEHTTAPNENKTETTKTTVKLKEPNKKNYDLNKFSGIKKYVNDCIKYKAAAEYGITKIIYDDTTHGTVMVGIFLLNTFQTLNIIRSIQILFFRQVLELQLMN